MKKGFTLLELSIVLVVIGLILGMAIKGKELIDTARIRSELIRLNKFESAMNIYQAKANRLPTVINKVYDYRPLVEIGALTERDFRSDMVNDNWTLVECAPKSLPNYGFADSGGDACAKLSRGAMPDKIVCSIESMLDNKATGTGLGRIQSATAVNDDVNFATPAYDTCDTVGTAHSVDYWYMIY